MHEISLTWSRSFRLAWPFYMYQAKQGLNEHHSWWCELPVLRFLLLFIIKQKQYVLWEMCNWRIRTILVSGHLQLRTPFLPSEFCPLSRASAVVMSKREQSYVLIILAIHVCRLTLRSSLFCRPWFLPKLYYETFLTRFESDSCWWRRHWSVHDMCVGQNQWCRRPFWPSTLFRWKSWQSHFLIRWLWQREPYTYSPWWTKVIPHI